MHLLLFLLIAVLFPPAVLAGSLPGISCSGAGGTDCNRTIPALNPGVLATSFAVSGCDQVQDVNVGLALDHGWTGDLVVTLQSPGGTRVRLLERPGLGINGDYGCAFDDVAALLDDQALIPAASACTDDQGGTQPALSGSLQPAEPLAAFDGDRGNGVWTLWLQDFGASDGGSLQDWSLQLTCLDLDVDLQMDKKADVEAVALGGTVTYILTVVNAGGDDASGVVVTDPLPAGLSFVASECAAAAGGTVIWRVGSLAAGATIPCQLTARYDGGPGGTLVNTASVAADQGDGNPADNAAGATVQGALFLDGFESGDTTAWATSGP